MSASSPDALRRRIESGARAGIAWAAFEPNSPKLRSRVRRELGRYMQELFEQGAFQGRTRKDAYFVKCGTDTMTPADIAQGNLIAVIGFAEVRPAEFIVLTIGQTVQSSKSGVRCRH